MSADVHLGAFYFLTIMNSACILTESWILQWDFALGDWFIDCFIVKMQTGGKILHNTLAAIYRLVLINLSGVFLRITLVKLISKK